MTAADAVKAAAEVRAEAAHQKPFASIGIATNRGKGVVELDIAGRLADASRAVAAAGLRICGGGRRCDRDRDRGGSPR